jgi:ribose transport system substrate-binding protein
VKRASAFCFGAALLLAAGFVFGQTGDPYRAFHRYRAMASTGKPYAGAPLKGRLIGFANIVGTFPFCVAVENNLKDHLKRAGLDLKRGWISMDNQGDPVAGLKNAELMLARKPDLFIEFQVDAMVNSIVGAKFSSAGIPVLAIDQPVPGSPLVGIDNYKVSLLCGHTMAKMIRELWGGWDGVDAVILGQEQELGEVSWLRTEGAANALAEEFGIEPADPKIVRFEMVNDAPEESSWGFADFLAAHPGLQRLAITAINEIYMAGIITALQGAGRWDPANTIIVTLGMDEIGQLQLRQGLSDAGIAFFPERYGEYIVPAVCAMLRGKPVPPYIYLENEVITRDNIDRWYPKKK